MSMHHPTDPQVRPKWSRINQWLLWIGLAAAVAWLVFGHGEHLLKVAPLLVLLACPLMHMFGHGGHGHHGGHGGDESRTRSPHADRAPPESGGRVQ